MEKFLTEQTKFQCTVNKGIIFSVSDSGNVKHNSASVLTVSTKLSRITPPMPCPLLPPVGGVPQPCQAAKIPPAWLNFDIKHFANGKNLLTENSFCNCPFTQTSVKVMPPVNSTFCKG